MNPTKLQFDLLISQLTPNTLKRWRVFRSSLSINSMRLLFDFTLGFLCLACSLFFADLLVKGVWLPFTVTLALSLSLWIGFWIHYLSCYLHEAAHFNLLPNRLWNDRVANLLFGPFLGFEIKSYRESHWKHHLRLGQLDDTEFSYQKPFTKLQLVKEFFGLTLIQALMNYHRPPITELIKPRWPGMVCPIVHLAVVGTLFTMNRPIAGLGWIVGFFFVFPFIARVRQTLEHREFEAPKEQSDARVCQRAVTRMFGTGLFSRCLGSAGFNRHLLHHLAPTVSYTRFNEVEHFLLTTELHRTLLENSSTYWKTLIAFLGGERWKIPGAPFAISKN